MPVNYQTPQFINHVNGVELGSCQANIRKANRYDLTLITLSNNTTVAGVFTQNSYCAAPVLLCRRHLSKMMASGENIRALLINTGIANAGTGAAGLAVAEQSCQAVADALQISPSQVLPFSTGVILDSLPLAPLVAGIAKARSALNASGWLLAAEAIMTTDTVAKAATRQINCQGKIITISGIAKGAGMIKPNMATMLGFVFVDAQIDLALLNQLTQEVASLSFNAISVDGDTSTNDSFIIAATGAVDAKFSKESDQDWAVLAAAITEVAVELAQAIVRDGEGASKFITITVDNARTHAESKAVAYAIANSPLVKTAFFASDPNLGRILAAIGNAGIAELDIEKIEVSLADSSENILVAAQGGRAASYQESVAAKIMQSSEISININLARGSASGKVYTCDFSYDYVKINADYRS